MKNLLFAFKSVNDPVKREEIVRSILDIDFQTSLELLQEALNDNNPIVRYAAVEEIGAGRIGLTEQLLVILRGDTDFMVRAAAAESLGMIGNPAAVPVLLGALSDRNALVRGWAATSLAQFPTEDIGSILKQNLNSERQHFVKVCIISTMISRGESNISLLLPELRYRNYKVRCATATALSELADKTNLTIIVHELSYRLKREKYASVRSCICAALVRLGSSPKSWCNFSHRLSIC